MKDNLLRILETISTNVSTNVLRERFLGKVPHKLKKDLSLQATSTSKYNKDWVDPLTKVSSDLLKLDKSRMSSVKYTGEPLTTIAFNYYGSTSYWPYILRINGIMHPHEISHGTILLLPAKLDIDRIISQMKPEKSIIGKVVTI